VYTQRMLDTSKVKAKRVELGLSQADAAKRAGMGGGRQQWSNIETGAKADVTMTTLGKIARALKCKPAELLK
jgi:transcriptional regulator with XRE-family HTH domain